MAGNFNNLATELSASASRLKANINSLFEKYDRQFHNDDLISLSSMSVCRLSSKGALRTIKGRHGFGDSKLKTTKKKEELLKAKLGLHKNKVDLNVSRAIHRECAVALADLNEANADEPSDAETLSSFDEDEFDEEDDEKSVSGDEEQNVRDSNDNSDSNNSSRLTDNGSGEYFSIDRSGSIESSLNSSGEKEISYGLEKASRKDVHKFNTTVTLISDSEDSVDDDVSDVDVVRGGATKASELTFIFDSHDNSLSEQTRAGNMGHDDLSPTAGSQEDVEKSIAHTTTKKSLSVKSFVSISSPRPKIRGKSQTPEYGKNFNFLTSMPNSSKSNQTFVADKSKCAKTHVVNKLDDDLFKSPQGIRVKRVVPVFVGPINPALVSPKQSSHSSGFSSGSSSWKTRETSPNNDGNTFNFDKNFRSERVQLSQTVQDTPVYDDVRIIEGQQNRYHPLNREPPPHCNNEWQFTNAKFDSNRVEQWVDLVNSNTPVSNQPLYYPSCPPKVPGQFSSIPQVSQTLASSFQQSMMSPSRSFNQRDVGIQTNLNSTVESSRRDVLLKKMKDVSIVLSNSFLEAHSPKPQPSCSYENMRDTSKENCVLKPVNNTMFHEDYIYQFSPLNPNRRDSDEVTNLHQTHCMKQGLRHFRPRRNEKRPFMSEVQNDSLSSNRPSKYRKINDCPDPKSDHRSGDNSFVLPNILSRDDLHHTYIIHSSTRPLQAHNDSSGGDPNFLSSASSQKRTKSQISRPKSLSQAEYNNLKAKANSFRASSPLHVNDCDVLNDHYGVINSSVSEAEILCSCRHNEHVGQSLMPPKLGVFLDSNSNEFQSKNNNCVCTCHSKSARETQNRYSQEDSFAVHIEAESSLKDSSIYVNPQRRQMMSHTFSSECTNLKIASQLKPSNRSHLVSRDVLNSTQSDNVSSVSPSSYFSSMVHKENREHSISLTKAKLTNCKSKKSLPYFPRNQSFFQAETTGSGSFLDAHTPKPKLQSTMLSLHQDLIQRNEKEGLGSFSSEKNQSAAKPEIQKKGSYLENMIHRSNDSSISIEEDSTEEYSLGVTVRDRDGNDSPSILSVLNVSSNREHHSDIKLLDITLSTIHGLDSDDEDKMKFDEDITDHRRQVSSKFNKDHESKRLESELSFPFSTLNSMRSKSLKGKEMYSNDYRHNNSPFSNKNDAKCSTQYKKHIQAFQPRRNQRRQNKTSGEQKHFCRSKEHKGQHSHRRNNPLSPDNFSGHHAFPHNRSSLKQKEILKPQETIFRLQNFSYPVKESTDILQMDRRNMFRASTPVPHLNLSLSTVYNPQDDRNSDEESDMSGEDWNSMLIQDVDVLS